MVETGYPLSVQFAEGANGERAMADKSQKLMPSLEHAGDIKSLPKIEANSRQLKEFWALCAKLRFSALS
jgi:hypothetical protein|tara:strand:- start:1840 stop:2046 length:207 start_codon:yes stop_codon:yes gene_type:complete